MHPIFDRDFNIEHKIVIYEHKNFPLSGIGDLYPKITNKYPFEEIIEFLGSAEVIITNSYHGAYWATLLGRKVVILQPFSSNFFGFHHPLLVANNIDDIKSLTELPVYPNALLEAREANLKFLEKVRSQIEQQGVLLAPLHREAEKEMERKFLVLPARVHERARGASHFLALKKPFSSFKVPEVGIEPT